MAEISATLMNVKDMQVLIPIISPFNWPGVPAKNRWTLKDDSRLWQTHQLVGPTAAAVPDAGYLLEQVNTASGIWCTSPGL